MKKKTIIIILIIVILLTVVGIIIYNNTQKKAVSGPLRVASVWDAPVTASTLKGDTLNFNDQSIREYVKLSRQGFEKGVADGKGSLEIDEILISGGTDVQAYNRKVNDFFSSNEVLMTVGTSSDETTMYTSMEMNFFKIPMLIPFADGNLSPDNIGNEYSFRLTASSDKYAEFFDTLFMSNINDFLNTYVFGGRALPVVGNKVSVFFEDNFNGNEAAVKITQNIIDNGYDVQSYMSFPMDSDLVTAVQAAWVSVPEDLKNVSAVVIIGEDQASADNLEIVWHAWEDQGLHPFFYMVGYEPMDLSQDILNADNVFFIQPHVNIASCPAGITSRAEAVGYSAGQIMVRALQQAMKDQPAEPSGISLWFQSEERQHESHQEYLSSFRSNIRAALKDLDDDIPCYGKLNFNADPDEQVKLELVRYTGKNQFEPADVGALSNAILQKNRDYYGLE